METWIVKTKRTLKEGAEALRHFGWNVASARVGCIWGDEALKNVRKKNETILAYLKHEYKDLLEQYSSAEDPSEELLKSAEAPVWVFWLQGKKEMPELIQMCQRSREAHAGKHPVIVLDRENVRDYVTFPDEVWQRVTEGKLRVQHLADMVRVQLIRKYGGLWLDASIFCHREIPEEVFSYPVYSLKGDYMPQFVSGNRWTTFLIGGRPGNVLCSFLDDFFASWMKKGKPFIDYFMFDCAIALAYENIPAVKKEIDDLPKAEGDCYWLKERLSEPVSEELLQQFLQEPAVFYKIAWNKEWNSENESSLYHYLREKNESSL